MLTQMYFLYVFTLIFCCVNISSFDVSPKKLFIKFIEKYRRAYKNETAEFEKRFSFFQENLKRYSMLNAAYGNNTVYGINEFSDLSPEEFKKMYLEDLIQPLSQRPSGIEHTPIEQLRKLKIPRRVDWRDKKIISAVKNQGTCGACWAFSVVETVESMYANVTGQPVPDLSVQEVIDCDTSNYGCRGGNTCSALKWMTTSPVGYDKDYPLKDVTQVCHYLPSGAKSVGVSAYTCNRFVGEEEKMLQLLSFWGPLTVTVDASTWNSYVGGIIRYHCDNFNNHAVQIVGYDLTGNVPFYIVRNSWGEEFGDKGYLYIAVGKNLCGLAESVSTVKVKAG